MAFWRDLFLMQLGILFCLSTKAEAIEVAPAYPMAPKCIDPNKVYGYMRTCYNNCENMSSTTENCITPSVVGCDCKNGYVYQSATSNTCIPVSNCKVICPANMHFDPCIMSYRKTCATLSLPPVPTGGCLARCVCNTGYVLSNAPIPVCVKSCKFLPLELPDLAILKV